MSDMQTTVAELLSRAPEWLRRDLVSDDKIARQRAEEPLAAMIADALSNHDR